MRAAGTVLALGLLAVVVPGAMLDGARLLPGDAAAFDVADAVRGDGLVAVSRLVTGMGTFWWTTVASAVACVGLWARGHRLAALTLGLGYVLMLLGVEVVRPLADRPRPEGGLVETTTSSFPSAHTAHSVLWAALAVLVARGRAVVALGVSVVLVVAATRIVLSVHNLSDVVAGIGVGAAGFALAVLAVQFVGRVRQDGPAR